jgi:hypothetical protein
MVSKHSELAKRQAQERYKWFAPPLSRTTPPPHQEVGSSSRHRTAAPPSCMQEVGSSTRRHTAPPHSRQEEASSYDSMGIWVVAHPPSPLTRLEEASSSNDSPSDSSGYNVECPHVKEVSSYELLVDFNCLV